ncbi:MAG: NAD synthetase [Planctomycetaceae bacterium]|nr:NAD synthetase [Planctomycetaceae bacterium]
MPGRLWDLELVELVYMVAAFCFVLGLKRLGAVRTARSGNLLASLGMLFAVVATVYLVFGEASLVLLLVGLVLGGAAGVVLARRVPMTAMPELVAFFNGLGGAASMLVALAEIAAYTRAIPAVDAAPTMAEGVGALGGVPFSVAVVVSILIGALTLSGSLVAYGKLSGRLKVDRIGLLGSRPVNGVLFALALGLGAWAGFAAAAGWPLSIAALLLVLASLALGLGLVLPIGGADMPVVISLLNSYSGVAASATGFVLENNLLIVAGALVGASGLILTQVMCRAMNRSLSNVLFAGYGAAAATEADTGYTGVKSTTPEELALLLQGAQSVIIVPGYGLAVAQAQHKVRELAGILEKSGAEVRYAIHPVAGRMPGHMNVLLAEADVPYEQLFELDQINGDFAQADVVVVLGANDVCNPAATRDPKSPIAGMPVLHVWEARTVVVVKRSLAAGYAGIKNPLFEGENTLMLFADAKAALEGAIAELKANA